MFSSAALQVPEHLPAKSIAMRASTFIVAALSATLTAAASIPSRVVARQASCDLSGVQQPVAPTPLPTPSAGLSLILIAHGTGTQNYTCADQVSAPAAAGAVATLTDVSCSSSGPAIGRHFFYDLTTPEFDVTNLGKTLVKKLAASTAPANTRGDVPWLKLTTAGAAASTTNVKEIYRLSTQGGSAPATCSGLPAAFQVAYQANYWFYSS